MAKKFRVLGIETSCDETGLAIVEKETDNYPKVLTNLVYSQEEIHRETKGVVPEIAARAQVEKIFPLLEKLNNKIEIKDLDAIAITKGPGLVGSLLVGINLAKTLSFIYKKPLLTINHVLAHLYASFIEESLNNKEIRLPALGLIVSGGHTSLVLIKDHFDIQVLGQTKDDAAGEAFDKVAVLLGLNYPGGPEIERAASKARERSQFDLPRPLIDSHDYNFSFSGLKTAVLEKTRDNKLNNNEKCNLSFEFQEAVVDVLVEKTFRASLKHKVKSVILGGGVVANKRLREKLTKKRLPNLIIPPFKYCTDSGAIIAARGAYKIERGKTTNWQKLEVLPNLTL
jgi:N6-L-threonylcarbamoyladenine synthase